MDKQWISALRNRVNNDSYIQGVQSFMESAKHHLNWDNKLKCPCMKCLNSHSHPIDVVEIHLLTNCMSIAYNQWKYHGEQIHNPSPTRPSSSVNEPATQLNDDIFELVDDLFPKEDMNDTMGEENYTLRDEDTLSDEDDTLSDEDTEGIDDIRNVSREDEDTYEKLLQEAQRELYPGCSEYSVLTFVVELIQCKVKNLWTNKSVNELLKIMKKMCSKPNNIPESYYACKKVLKGLGLGYENIHACKYDCALFYKEHEGKDRCPFCNEPRYKNSDHQQKKKIPQKVLRYFPLKTRLQRLFMSRHTSSDMRWHKDKRVDEEGNLRHPADSIAWKHFDKTYPEFAEDSRNVRLGLATDGFNPFGNMSTSYSMWPVVVVPYNLPPWMCMKKTYSMLTLLIPGPQAPGKDLDVFLRPLIDELKELWEIGVKTYDKMTESYFTMHVAVMWTISDFPAYANLSGWSTKGYLACPVCNKDTSSQMLTNKIGYIGHRCFLPMNHSMRKDSSKDTFNGKREMKPPPREFSGVDILEQLDHIIPCQPGKHPDNKDRKRKRNVEELNWTHKSIFFELEYWSKLKIRHNLDVMHIEKNICDSIVGTLLNIEGKSKDTYKARLDLQNMNIKKDLWVTSDENVHKIPQAEYVFTQPQQKFICAFFKLVKFPYGYAANISRNVNVNEGKISGLKSHDCHVLLHRLLPVGIRKHLKKKICTPLVKLSHFFHQICAKKLTVAQLDRLEIEIVEILCNLEKIFPPAFFDIMVHLAVHLPREAKLAGPVGFRWMYPIERLLGSYKQYVRNRARPEGSIAEAYISYEALTYCTMYLRDVDTTFHRPEPNYFGDGLNPQISVFAQKVLPTGTRVMIELSKQELEVAYWYILNNSDEIEVYRREHEDLLKAESPDNIDQRHREQFPKWFREGVTSLYDEGLLSEEMYILAKGPDRRSVQYSGCIANDIKWSNKEMERYRTTQDSGVMTIGSHKDKPCTFYGDLVSVVQLQFQKGYNVFLFKCQWYNSDLEKMKFDYHLTSVNVSTRWYNDDPYVLASQAQKVFYLDDPKLGHPWRVVQQIQYRHVFDVLEKEEDEVEDDIDSDSNSPMHVNNINNVWEVLNDDDDPT